MPRPSLTYALFIDDERFPPDKPEWTWVIVRSLDEAIAHIKIHGAPQRISFDHDLGEGAPTGKDFANWLIEQDLNADGEFLHPDFEWTVHSMNPVGAENISSLMRSYLHAKQKPKT